MKVAAHIIVSAFCFAVVAAEVDIRLVDRGGANEVPPAVARLDVRRSCAADGAETFVCRVVSEAEGRSLLRLEAHLPVDSDVVGFFDGRRERPLSTVRTNAFLIEAFPLGAVWNAKGRGTSLALGAEAGDSYVDFISSPRELVISVRAALLGKGTAYETVFHRIPFNAKYGAMDAFARYYEFYPKRFRRNPEVDPALNGINANYSSWRRADPEPCRFMNATWECCIGAARTWGDLNDREQPIGPRNTAYSWDEEIGYVDRAGRHHRERNGEITQAKFDAILDERLGAGYFCGVRNAYYAMALANISSEIAKRHPDSVAVGRTFSDSSYSYSTEVFPFPECSWGRDVCRQLKELSERGDVSAVYFDVSRPRGIYRGAKLAEMKNVSWDDYGPGVARSVASAKLFDYMRTLPAKCGRYRMGVTLNTKYEHLNDIFFSDCSDSECCPWDHEKPFPIERRLAAGEKGYQLWEGFSTDEFDPNFRSWPAAEKNLLLNALARFAVHASYRTGASLPVSYLSEYTALMSHAFTRMNLAGWKPVPGARVKGGDWELARYGLGDGSYLAVNNLSNAVRRAEIEVFPEEIVTGRAGGASAGKGVVYAPFYGGAAEMRLEVGRETVSFPVGALLSGVLEAVGTVSGEGALAVEYGGDFDAVRVRVKSQNFHGKLVFRDSLDDYRREGTAERCLEMGGTLEVVYNDGGLRGLRGLRGTKGLGGLGSVVQAIRALKGDEAIHCAPDGDSRDLAERVVRFFAAAEKGKRVQVEEDASLGRGAISIGGIAVKNDDRWELSRQVNRLLNAINRERYPEYRPPIPMAGGDRRLFTFVRL